MTQWIDLLLRIRRVRNASGDWFMPDAGSINTVTLERYRDLLLMLARTQLGPKYRSKIALLSRMQTPRQ